MRTERNKPRGCSSLLSLSDLTQTTLGRIINNYRVSLMLTSPHWSAKRFSFSLLLSETNIFILLRCFSIFTVDIRQSAGIDSQAVAVCSFRELKWWNCVVANAVCVHLICTKFVVSFVYIALSRFCCKLTELTGKACSWLDPHCSSQLPVRRPAQFVWASEADWCAENEIHSWNFPSSL